MILTDEEIEAICVSERSIAGIEICRSIESAVLAKIKAQGASRWVNPANDNQVQVLANAYKVTGYIPLYKLPEDA